MTDAEAEKARDLFGAAADNPIKRLAAAAGNGLVVLAVILLIFAIGWQILCWLVKLVFGLDIGFGSPYAYAATGIAAVTGIVVAGVSAGGWLRQSGVLISSLSTDIDDGEVREEQYVFDAAKCFQEPEHGGLIYFLRFSDDASLVLYDHESQSLAIEGKSDKESRFEPRVNLNVIRVPNSGLVIDRAFAGGRLDACEPKALKIPPSDWPEDEEVCQIPWNELESRLC